MNLGEGKKMAPSCSGAAVRSGPKPTRPETILGLTRIGKRSRTRYLTKRQWVFLSMGCAGPQPLLRVFTHTTDALDRHRLIMLCGTPSNPQWQANPRGHELWRLARERVRWTT